MNLPLPRPPAWIWLFTTQSGPPSFLAASAASSGVKAGKPSATGRAEGPQHRLGLVFVDVHRSEDLEDANARLRRAFRAKHQAASAGLIALQASIRPWTAATDFSNIAFSASSNEISMIRSTPFAPITTGTPT